MIDVEVGIVEPGVLVRVPAVEDSLPVVRQVLRALGDTLGAEHEALEDAELALTEACANAVEHAYPDGDGIVEVSLESTDRDLVVSVRDFGRGMDSAAGEPRSSARGYGLVMIDGIARDVQIRGDGGTEVAMTIGMGEPQIATVDGAAPGIQPAERVLRRLVAVIAAQVDMPVDRTLEALLVAEMVARSSLRRLVGDRVRLRVSRAATGLELRVGPLEENGAQVAVRESEVPTIGAIVERLADGIDTERDTLDGVEVEHLVIRLDARGPA